MRKKIKQYVSMLMVMLMAISAVVFCGAEKAYAGSFSGGYISLGADLTSDEKAKVLALFGVDEKDLDNYKVVYVTNQEEHQYLDSYISSSQIGNQAWSSVLITEGKKGSGINVTTKNVIYCTTGMYANALATAGVEDVNVVVAGPFNVSGTAALVGALKAYSEMTGETVDEDVVDAAVDEMVTTGSLEETRRSRLRCSGRFPFLRRTAFHLTPPGHTFPRGHRKFRCPVRPALRRSPRSYPRFLRYVRMWLRRQKRMQCSI